MHAYLPEGMEYSPQVLSPELLRAAASDGRILQARAVMCSEAHDLLVELGGMRAVIPRQEAALGIREGTTRDIAILTRVGKIVCFRVTGILPDGTPLLSRRAAQEAALEHFLSLPAGTILPAVVTACTPFGAFCDIGCGVPALIGLENICAARIRHAGDIFTEGQRIFAAVLSAAPLRRRIVLTHKELLGTWAENAACFRHGQTVTGTVRGVCDYGVFVELTPNLSGLADPYPGVQNGDGVCVYIKSIQPDRCKLKLAILSRLDAPPVQKPRYFQTSGSTAGWHYR